MATTPRKLRTQITQLLERGPKTTDSKLSERHIQTQILQACGKVLKTQWYEDRKLGADHNVNHLCIATYTDVAITLDEDRGRCFALLPASPEPLPGGLGVQEVKPWKAGDPSEERAMIPLAYGDRELLAGLTAGEEILSDSFCYELDRDRVWFTEKDNETILDAGIDEVEMKLVIIDPAEYDDNDTLPLSPSQEFEVLKEVLLLNGFNPAQIADVTNDGNPNKRN
jgi:hypothetical protein